MNGLRSSASVTEVDLTTGCRNDVAASSARLNRNVSRQMNRRVTTIAALSLLGIGRYSASRRLAS